MQTQELSTKILRAVARTFHQLAAAVVSVIVLTASSVSAGNPTIIRGSVVDLDGNPLVGVTMTAVSQDGESSSTTTTKKKGRFALRVPDWDKTYRVTCAFDGYGTVEAMVQPNPDDPPTVDITLARQAEQAPPPPVAEDPPPADDEVVAVSEQRLAAIPVFNEGVDALQAEDQAAALAKFQQAAELDPDFPDAYRAIAAVAIQAEEYPIAADAAEKLLELKPDDLDTIGTAYYAELMMGDTDRMVVSAGRLADANPEIVSAELLQHATALFDNNLAAQSRALLEVILQRQPDLAPAQFQLGLSCNMLGDAECTRAALTRFLELAPDDANAEIARSLLEYLN